MLFTGRSDSGIGVGSRTHEQRIVESRFSFSHLNEHPRHFACPSAAVFDFGAHSVRCAHAHSAIYPAAAQLSSSAAQQQLSHFARKLWSDCILKSQCIMNQQPGETVHSTLRKHHDPYRRSERIPRQTLHNKKRRKLLDCAAKETFEQPLEIACQNISGDTDLPPVDDTLDLFVCEAEDDPDTRGSVQHDSPPNKTRLFP